MRGVARYQNTQKTVASPAQIVLMLLQTAIQRLTRASDPASVGSSAWYRDLHRVREILLELKFALDHEAAPNLCERLANVYDWSMKELVRAGSERNTEPVINVLRSTTSLLEGWNTVVYSRGM